MRGRTVRLNLFKQIISESNQDRPEEEEVEGWPIKSSSPVENMTENHSEKIKENKVSQMRESLRSPSPPPPENRTTTPDECNIKREESLLPEPEGDITERNKIKESETIIDIYPRNVQEEKKSKLQSSQLPNEKSVQESKDEDKVENLSYSRDDCDRFTPSPPERISCKENMSKSPIIVRPTPLVREGEICGKGRSSPRPPNVTVIPPSPNHPMFSYLYPSNLIYPGSASSLPVGLGQMGIGAGNLGSHGAFWPWPHLLPSSSSSDTHSHSNSSDLPNVSQYSTAGLLNGHFSLPALHSLWHQQYLAALASQSGSLGQGIGEGRNEHRIHSEHNNIGHIMPARTVEQRFTPYQVPLPRANMGMRSPPTPPSATSLPRSMVSPPSSGGSYDTRPRSRHEADTPVTTKSAINQLKNIEEMVNGLDRTGRKIDP